MGVFRPHPPGVFRVRDRFFREIDDALRKTYILMGLKLTWAGGDFMPALVARHPCARDAKVICGAQTVLLSS